jgi:hypothetical protein
MISQFNLPAFFHPKKFNNSLIKEVQSHIYDLTVQKSANEFLQVFEKYPHIESFALESSYESNDEGGTYLSFSVYDLTLKDDSEESEDEVHDSMYDFLYNVKEDEIEGFLESLCDCTISRETIERVVKDAMGSKEYDAWKANVEKYDLEQKIAKTDKESDLQKI